MQRKTRQREAIQTVLKRSSHPMNAEEIFLTARKQVEGLGIATVYRTLKSLQEEGAIQRVCIEEQSPRYERADLHHHHHFYCEACDQVFEIEACAPGVNHMAPEGFEVKRHEITLFGRCEDCR